MFLYVGASNSVDNFESGGSDPACRICFAKSLIRGTISEFKEIEESFWLCNVFSFRM